jgi:hypothetical protein
MKKCFCLLFLGLAMFSVAGNSAQHPVLDAISDRIVQKYQASTCEQLWQQKAQKKSPTPQEQKIAQLLRNDPQMRAEFINKVAPPIANKMLECGMIP